MSAPVKEKDKCPKCGSTKTKVANYNMMWGDGDLVCARCGTKIRDWDRD